MSYFGIPTRNGLPIGLGSSATLAAPNRAWSPSSLFSAGERGIWYDPSDLSTMFLTASGITQVTAVTQPVGLILDKSQGLVLGPELTVNGSFNTDTAWTKGTGWTIGSGVASKSAGTAAALSQNMGLVQYKTYLITFNIVCNAGSITIRLGDTIPNLVFVSVTGSYTYRFQCPGATGVAYFSGDAAFTGSIDNISFKEIPGQHSKQATAGLRPILSAAPTRINFDVVDDTLVALFSPSFGTDCTVCRAVPGVSASILTAQTIGTTYTDNTDYCGLIIVNRALTAGETANVTKYLNAQAGA